MTRLVPRWISIGKTLDRSARSDFTVLEDVARRMRLDVSAVSRLLGLGRLSVELFVTSVHLGIEQKQCKWRCST